MISDYPLFYPHKTEEGVVLVFEAKNLNLSEIAVLFEHRDPKSSPSEQAKVKNFVKSSIWCRERDLDPHELAPSSF